MIFKRISVGLDEPTSRVIETVAKRERRSVESLARNILADYSEGRLVPAPAQPEQRGAA
jgi:hypothetical protein